MKHKRSVSRIMSLISAAVLTAGIAAAVPERPAMMNVSAVYGEDDFNYTEGTSGNIKYAKYSDRIEILGCTDGVSDLVIPSEIDGMPVTAIKRYAFQTSSVKSVTIPESVKTIGYWAFSGCKTITSVKLPSSLQVIEMHAFDQCPSLTTVEFPDSFIEMHTKVFDETPWLEAQRQKDPLVIINGDLIDARTAKGDVTIPSDVKYVSSGAFSKNTDVTSVVYPRAVSRIDDDTFFGCTNLTSIEATGAEMIGAMAISGCNKLTSLKLSDKLTSIHDYGFSDTTSTATITFYGSRDSWERVQKPNNDPFLQRANLVFESSLPDPTEPPTDPPTDPPTEPTTAAVNAFYGDANCDERINVADAVAILQFVANQTKYPLTERGLINADIDGAAGITGTDAIVIQKVDAGVVKQSDLPLSN
ncbi:MAG: leucine-rich repeat protein [Ruminococcus sp.]|nr:leucine-rich repeat protein [Ruminococcus sp.]